jgi:uncharacterized protein YbaR (Trm112 family)
MANEELLKILACPVCKAGVILKENKIVCTKCCRKYLIEGGIPIMMAEEAETNESKSKKQ